MQIVESIYPLARMQEGILLRLLQTPGVVEYVEQTTWRDEVREKLRERQET